MGESTDEKMKTSGIVATSKRILAQDGVAPVTSSICLDDKLAGGVSLHNQQ